MAQVEITDRISARAWLKKQPHQTQIWFAARCALRVVPSLRTEPDETFDHLAFISLRAMLISAAAAACPAAEIRQLRTAASAAAAYATTSASSSATASAAAAYATAAYAASAAYATTATATTIAAYATTATATTTAATAAAASADTGSPGRWDSLWPDAQIPQDLNDLWAAMKQTMQAAPEKWAFWLEWYEAILNGNPLNWDLTLRIAKEVKEAEWDAGPEVVAQRIKEIRDQFWAETLPQHEVLETDPKTGKFTVSAMPFDPADAIEKWLVQIDFATSLAIDSNSNDFNRMCTAYKFIDHSLTNCRDDPNAIEQNLGIAHDIFEKNIANPDYYIDDSFAALAQVVRQIQIQMRADHPDVRKAWEKRIAQKLREADRETKLMAATAIRAETARTQGRLTIDMELDADAVENTVSEDAVATSLRRAGGRSAKMNTRERAEKTIKDIDNSAPYKATRMGTTGWSVVDFLAWLF